MPNCADVSLVMWVVCETVDITDPYTGVNLGPVNMIKFIISRGFNLHEYSHGLIGKLLHYCNTVVILFLLLIFCTKFCKI